MIDTVTFVPVNPPGPSVVAHHGDGPLDVHADGGWAFVARPRRVGFTEWDGENPYTMTGPILFEGFTANRSVEGPVEALRRMLRNPVGPRKEPPVIQVRGPAVPHSQRLWVLNGLEPGDVIRNSRGVLLRAHFTVTLLEYVAGDVIVGVRATAAAAAKARAASAAKATPGKSTTAKTYVVRRGDTLSIIASKQLGNANRWHEIADLNGLRDPKALKVGATLRLP